MAEWDDSCVVFLLKVVKIETEGTHKHFSVFFIAAFFGWSEVKKKQNKQKCDKKLQMCPHSHLPVVRDKEKRQDRVRQRKCLRY